MKLTDLIDALAGEVALAQAQLDDSLRELATFPVECPRLNPNGEDIQALNQLLAASRAANTYVVLEDLAYTPSSAPGTPISFIDVRHPRLTVYNLAP